LQSISGPVHALHGNAERHGYIQMVNIELNECALTRSTRTRFSMRMISSSTASETNYWLKGCYTEGTFGILINVSISICRSTANQSSDKVPTLHLDGLEIPNFRVRQTLLDTYIPRLGSSSPTPNRHNPPFPQLAVSVFIKVCLGPFIPQFNCLASPAITTPCQSGHASTLVKEVREQLIASPPHPRHSGRSR
jgi:hypothetical protein